jgi:soluble lytic murein transglycosylase-like protein
MPIDELFQASTDQVLDDRVARPLQAPTVRPSFGSSVWNTVKAVPKGVVAGANESVAFGADILNAYGQTQAAIGLQADPTQLFDPDAQRKRLADGEQARASMASGDAYSTEIGTNLRATARDMMPDPATANLVENTLFGLSRFATKAIGYSVAAGPVPGAVLAGTDEGMTEADRLKSQGVDLSTRTQVGMVAGLSTAAAVSLPVAGKTLPQTIGLVAAGGPGSFIAQQAASKAILEHADYGKIADQYDPFDPVGLAVSTLVPAGFGAYAMRGVRAAAKIPTAGDPAAARQLVQMAGNERLALKYDDPRLDAYAITAAQREGIPPEALLAIKSVGEKSGPSAVSPKGAKGVMQFMDDTWAAYGKGDPRDPVASIDAGARIMKDLIKQYDGDVRAAIAHYNGGSKAGKAVHAGDLAPALETRKYLGRTDEFLAQHQGEQAGRAAANDPEAVAAARVALVRETVDSSNLHAATDIRGADDHMAAVMRASDQLAGGERVDVSDAIVPERLDIERVSDVVTRVQQAVEELKAQVRQEAGLSPVSRMPRLDLVRAELSGRIGDAAREVTDQMRAAATAVREFVSRAVADNRDNSSWHVLSEAISDTKRQRVLKDTGVDLGAAREQIRSDVVRHAQKSHPDLTPEDWNMLPWLLDNFDHVAPLKPGKNDKGQRLGFTAIDPKSGYAYVAEALAGKKKGERLSVVSFFRDHPNTVNSWLETNSARGNGEAGVRAQPDAHVLSERPPALRPERLPVTGESSIADFASKSNIDAQAAEIARLSPDMMVQLEGMDAPMRLADALEAVKAEAAKEVADAPLLQVAAECFLRSS